MNELVLARDAAHLAGGVAIKYYGKPLETISKGGVDFYTKADTEAENAARELLKQHSKYPIFGEESGGDRDAKELWVVDAIDGTISHNSGLTSWASVVCLVDGDTAKVSAVYIPTAKEMYYAERGSGAMFRGYEAQPLPIKTTEEEDPTKLIVGFDLGYEGRGWKLDGVKSFAGDVRYPIAVGSASVGASLVAAGKLGAYIIWDVDINDTLPGALLVEEAGGCAVNERGEQFTRNDRTLIAAGNEMIKGFILGKIGE
ncbi:MAG: inositol monophosphatase [Candidatus Aenigmarchaeota archaeon]|nr:inositol monophosphatase [Candidatus Aenigmarchaeota archaeon]